MAKRKIGDAEVFLMENATIRGREVARYLIEGPLIDLHVVQFELPGMELQTVVYPGDEQKAKNRFAYECKYILKEEV